MVADAGAFSVPAATGVAAVLFAGDAVAALFDVPVVGVDVTRASPGTATTPSRRD